MFRRFGLLSLALMTGSALFAPAAAFAQGPYQSYGNDGYYYNGYAPAPYQYEGRVREYNNYRERERREERREREWREHEWRQHERREHRYEDRYRAYPQSPYRY